MHIVSSQTAVTPLTRIRRQRILPQAGEVVVRVGQQVTPVQVVVRASSAAQFTIIPAGEMLGVPAEAIPDYLLVEEGAAVLRGTPLLRKPGWLNSKRVVAPVDGVLYQVTHGRLVLQQASEMVELRAMMHGFVVSYVSNRGVLIETQGTLIQAAWGAGREGYGKVQVVVSQPDEPLRAEHIGANARGMVLVAGKLTDEAVLEKAAQNSVRGIVVGSLPAGMAAAAVGAELPVLVTDAFGDEPMAEPIFRLLQQSEGREACLLDRSQERRHARPEIIISLPRQEDATTTELAAKSLTAGQMVRILRAPYLGVVGRVVTVHTRPHRTPIGTRFPGADVALPDGQVVFVPYPNLDIIG